jgi:cell division protein FtsB
LSNRRAGRILCRHPAPHSTIRLTRRRDEDLAIRPTPRSPLDSPITLRRLVVVLIAGVCGLVAFAVYGQVAQTRHLDAQVTALAAANTSLAQQISDREREIADAQTVAWLEEEARQLGYVFPGEKLYVIVPPGAAKASSGGVSVPIPTFKVPTPVPSPTPKPSASPSPSTSASPSSSPSPGHSPTPTPTPTPTPH